MSTTITGIEVSFDVFGGGAEIAATMYRNLKNPVSTNQRLYRRGAKFKEHTRNATKQTDKALISYLNKGYMIGIGDDTDDFYQRIYYKQTDINGGVNQIQIEPRARLEIRLQGNALPFRTLAELKRFKFTSLSKHLLFRLHRDSEATGTGKQYDADKVLNAHAGDALQRLSRSWPTLRKYTKKARIESTFFRHNCDHEQHGFSNEQTSANPYSERVALALVADAHDAPRSGSLITCVMDEVATATAAQVKQNNTTSDHSRLEEASPLRVSLHEQDKLEAIIQAMLIDDT